MSSVSSESRASGAAAAPTAPRALILAAGRGQRMRPLTDTTPKPLLALHGKPMIEWHIEALARAGVSEIVINTDWLETQFPAALGDGSRWGVRLHYSMEGRDHGGALETAGGVHKALPLLAPRGDDIFWLVSGDIHAPSFGFERVAAAAFAERDDDAHVWLVPNPGFHQRGDFAMDGDGRLSHPGGEAARPWTYANLALLRPRIVADVAPATKAPLGPLLFKSAAAGRLGGEALVGAWENVGTPAQLEALNAA